MTKRNSIFDQVPSDTGAILVFRQNSDPLQRSRYAHRFENGQDIDPSELNAPIGILNAPGHPLAATLAPDGRLITSDARRSVWPTAAITESDSAGSPVNDEIHLVADALSPVRVTPRRYTSNAVFHRGPPGIVTVSDWQDPNDHGRLSGYRIHITHGQNFDTRYAHMAPGTALPVGTKVKDGDYIGEYAIPTNGHSNGPHVHMGRVVKGARVDPGMQSPVVDGEISGEGGDFKSISTMHPKPHNGRDWRTRRK